MATTYLFNTITKKLESTFNDLGLYPAGTYITRRIQYPAGSTPIITTPCFIYGEEKIGDFHRDSQNGTIKTLTITLTGHNYQVGDKLKTDIYSGQFITVSTVVNANKFTTTINTTDSIPEDDTGKKFNLWKDTDIVSLPLDSKGNIRKGTYKVDYLGINTPYQDVIPYCFEQPVIDLAFALDCQTATLSVTDETEYVIDDVEPQMNNYELSLQKRNSLPFAIFRSSQSKSITLATPDLYAGEYRATVKTGEMLYIFTDYQAKATITQTKDYNAQCDKGVCDLFCGINTLRKKMEEVKPTNPTLWKELKDTYVLIMAYVENYYLAKKCKNETQASDILNKIKLLGNFTENCCEGDKENYQIIPFDACGCTDATNPNSCEPFINSYLGDVYVNTVTEVTGNNFSIRLDIQGRDWFGNKSSDWINIIPANFCGKKAIKVNRIINYIHETNNASFAGVLMFNGVFGKNSGDTSYETVKVVIPNTNGGSFSILENTDFTMVSLARDNELSKGGIPITDRIASVPIILGEDSQTEDPSYSNSYVIPIEVSEKPNAQSGDWYQLRKIDQVPLQFRYKNTTGSGFIGKFSVIIEGNIF